MEHGSLSQVTIGECLVADLKSSFLITDVEVTQNNAHSIGIGRPVRVNKMQSFKGKFWFEMNVDNNEVVSPRLYVHEVITALTSNHMCRNSFFR